MFKYNFAILCLALLSANESYGSRFFCPSEVLESLIKCLITTGINYNWEINGLTADVFNDRLKCARQVKCVPSIRDIWDRKRSLVRQFVECMEEISERILWVFEGYALQKYLHMFEWQCREKLAKQLPHDLQKYYLPLLGLKVI